MTSNRSSTVTTGSRPQSSVDSGVAVVGAAGGDLNNRRDDPLFNMLMTLQEAANTQPGTL